MRIVYPDTIRDSGNDLLTAVTGTDQSVKGCTTIDAALASTWNDWQTRVSAWLQAKVASPGLFGLGSLMDQIETYAQELLQWQTTINKYCSNVVSPVIDPTKIGPREEWWMKALQWTVVGVVVVGGAYAVGEVVSVLPKPVPGEPRRSLLRAA